MRCQYFYNCDPGETHAKQCRRKATVTVEFTYRHGGAKVAVSMCADCARVSTNNQNRWGKPFGHSAHITPLEPEEASL